MNNGRKDRMMVGGKGAEIRRSVVAGSRGRESTRLVKEFAGFAL